MEWTNVRKAKPLFRGHKQPKVPADLGYYDLRLPEVRIAQAEMAYKYGIEGFCYWHYWFGNGKRLLECPFNEVLTSGTPDFPFCLAWANHSWRRKGWSNDQKKDEILINQSYLGIDDYIKHFDTLLPAFKDKRYIRVNGKPLFYIFSPLDFPNIKVFIDLWQMLAKQNNLPGIFFVGGGNTLEQYNDILSRGLDTMNYVPLGEIHRYQPFLKRALLHLKAKFNHPRVYEYSEAIKYFSKIAQKIDVIPTILPNWDHTPRSTNGLVYMNSTPAFFGEHLKEICEMVKDKPLEERIVFLKSWNEWGEGNYMEPDLEYGLQYLEVLQKFVTEI
jgi:lipopolysaccharide biosynthesis protein